MFENLHGLRVLVRSTGFLGTITQIVGTDDTHRVQVTREDSEEFVWAHPNDLIRMED